MKVCTPCFPFQSVSPPAHASLNTEQNELNSATSAVSPTATTTESTPPSYIPPSTIQHQSFDDTKSPAGPGATASTTQTDPFAGAATAGKGPATTSTGTTTATGSFTSPPPPPTSGNDPTLSPTELAAKAHSEKEAKRLEAQAQREKMEAYDRERAEEKKERVRVLAKKLKDRIRPFVEARNPGGQGDSESKRFEERIREETGDLALESFGVGELGFFVSSCSLAWRGGDFSKRELAFAEADHMSFHYNNNYNRNLSPHRTNLHVESIFLPQTSSQRWQHLGHQRFLLSIGGND